MSLYPTLEDMVVDQFQTIQRQNDGSAYATSSFVEPTAPAYDSRYSPFPPPIYEAIGEFGASKEVAAYPTLPAYFQSQQNENISNSLAVLPAQSSAVQCVPNGQVMQGSVMMIAPLSSQTDGLQKANVTHGVRQIILAHDAKGKYGIRLRAINKGIFVQFVADGSPAAAAGIRFGDQILKIDDTEVVGLNNEKAMDLMIKSKNPSQLLLTIRDRPFERTITLHKDSNGNLGFTHKDNLITAIAKDSSASRNGLLINHRILEVDGRNVMAFKSKEVKNWLNDAPQTVTLTIMPSELYDEMVRKMDWSLMKKQDHSVPEI